MPSPWPVAVVALKPLACGSVLWRMGGAHRLTIVVKAGSKLPLRVTANTGNVALRVPETAIPRAIVSALTRQRLPAPGPR